MNTSQNCEIGRCLVIGFVAFACFSHGASWPGFRGESGDGISAEKNLPVQWSVTNNIKWQVTLPGRGNSSPVVTGTRVYLTTQTSDLNLWVIALDKSSGKTLWEKKLSNGLLAAKGPKNLYAHRHNPATSTPVADERHVWAFFGTGNLVCLDSDGNQKWSRNLVRDYGEYDITFGMGSSPRLWKNRLYLACMTKGPSYVVALDAKTGRTLWKKNRQLTAEDDGPDAYSTPVVWRGSDREELVVAGSDHVNAYDMLTGEQLWISSGLKIKSPYGRIIASPAVSPGVIVQCSGNPGGGGLGLVIALQAGNRGDVTTSARLWRLDRTTPDASTPVCYENQVYLVRANGITLCLDLKTGRKHWEERLAQGEYYSAPVAGDGKVYAIGTTGICTVMKHGEEFIKLAENKLPGKFYATPAISDGLIYFRSEDRLYGVGR